MIFTSYLSSSVDVFSNDAIGAGPSGLCFCFRGGNTFLLSIFLRLLCERFLFFQIKIRVFFRVSERYSLNLQMFFYLLFGISLYVDLKMIWWKFQSIQMDVLN